MVSLLERGISVKFSLVWFRLRRAIITTGETRIRKRKISMLSFLAILAAAGMNS
jgi:hypothetical protein